MERETLYKPKGAGHSAPEGERRDYKGPNDPLLDAFERWLKEGPSSLEIFLSDDGYEPLKAYNFAISLLPDLDGMTPERVNAVLLPYLEHPKIDASGYFLSAAYNKYGIREIVLDEDLEEISGIGFRLSKGSMFILRTTFGYEAFCGSRGIVVNHADVSDGTFGTDASGVCVNFGNIRFSGDEKEDIAVRFWEGVRNNETEGCTLINFGEMGSNYSPGGLEHSGIITDMRVVDLTMKECRKVPGLSQYLKGLKVLLGPRSKPEHIFTELRNRDIHNDIKGFLGKEWII